jgi:hypothetical protein
MSSCFASLAVSGFLILISCLTGCATPRGIQHLPKNSNKSCSTQTQSINEWRSSQDEELPWDLDANMTQESSSSESETIRILGGVKKPGPLPFRKDADLAFYLTEAGATPPESQSGKVQIIRGKPGKKKAQEFVLGQGSTPHLQSGDIVIVHPAKSSLIEKSITIAASAMALIGTAALLILVV